MNLIDKAIGYVSPSAGIRRIKDRQIMALVGAHNGGSLSRTALRNYNPSIGDANADTVYDLETLRARSSDLVRNSPLAAGAINTLVTKTIGTGLSMQPNPDSDALGWTDEYTADWKKYVSAEWELWCRSTDCDAARTDNFYQLQPLAFRSMLERADCLVLTPTLKRNNPYTLTIQIIEGDRLMNRGRAADTNNKIAGVTIDSNGAPVSYCIAKQHPGNIRAGVLEYVDVDAFGKNGRKNVLHLFEKKRPGQVRGVPFLSPVIEILKQISRHTEAELQAAVISATFAVFLQMDPEAFGSLFDDDAKGKYIDGAQKWNGKVDSTLDGPGKVVNLLPGETPISPNLGHPNVNFDPFFLSMVTQVGTALEIPREVLLKHFSSSYSASRAALLDFWATIRVRRDFMVTKFCEPIKELWFVEGVANGRIEAPGFFNDPRLRSAYTRANWIGDGQGSIDPAKEIGAAIDRIDSSVSTLEKECIAYDGGDWESNLKQRIKEHNIMKEGGILPPEKIPQPQFQNKNQDD